MRKGLIGYPLSHSYSKVIHEDVAGYAYDLIEIVPSNFEQFMLEKQFDALNVTIPYKQQIITYLDELDDKAKRIGAVNTVVNVSGKLIGYNTDYYGFKWMIEHHGIDLKSKRVVILGHGGATKAIQVVVHDLGASECLIVSRTKSKDTISYDDLYQLNQEIDVLINATPVGMFPNHEAAPVDLSRLSKVTAVVDIVYNPLKTELLLQTEQMNVKAVGGLEMLVAQAKEAIEIFTNKQLDDQVIVDTTKKIVKQKQNIVFIGMPSAGKTTLAKEIANHFDLSLIDIDEEIERESNKSIKDIFEIDGEEEFRRLESQKIREVCMMNHVVISCGGGVVKSLTNINQLKKMGILFWIDRDVDLLQSDSSRPLSKDTQAIKQLYEERFSLYQHAADFRIKNNTTIDEACNEIISEIERG